ncbi:response regulator transcription factor [Amycolatopsis sp. SID8362]|uniref:helix-turn-helix transcriptional regulator n=1 Tax=Amycolatopsis sp. SID8362 TaxID=2690346 RepID=UPI0019409C63|nr:response regulator transcription factor [Amycolatopsis sp. SID8362]
MAIPQLLDPRAGPALERASLRVFALGAYALTRAELRTAVEAGAGLRWLGSTGSVRTADAMIRAARPDVLVLHNVLDPDARLAGHLTAAFPQLAVVVLVDERVPVERHARVGVHAVVPVGAARAVLATSIRLAHAQHSGQPAAGEFRPSTMLSARQHQILSLIAEGNSYAEIGQLLFISTETVRTHVKQVLRRLRARDRTHAVALAYRAGLLVVPGRSSAPPSPWRAT